jgi:DNA-binding response OmpR family regulator
MADILVIDDDPSMRNLVSRILTAEGHAVRQAQNGVAGLAEFRRMYPALVITDMVMPDAEGIETIRELRREAPTLPIIAMSGSGALYLKSAARLGATATIEKPFRPADFRSLVDSLLDP